MTIGDRVSYRGKKGVICRDRMNGMVDMALDYNEQTPDVFAGTFTCGGTIECIYKDELELIEVAR